MLSSAFLQSDQDIGAGMGVNYGPTAAETLTIMPSAEMILERWYHVRFLIDLDTSRLDNWVGL